MLTVSHANLGLPDLTGFDLRALPPAFHDNPYRWYAALREQSPVRTLPDGSVLLTRYRDCEAVYRDPRLFSSDKRAEFGPKYGVDSPLYQHHTSSLVFNDPPLHSRVRRLIAGALTARATDAAPLPLSRIRSAERRRRAPRVAGGDARHRGAGREDAG